MSNNNVKTAMAWYKAIVTTVLCICGWVSYWKGYQLQKEGRKEEAKGCYMASLLYSIPSTILSLKGWSIRHAIKATWGMGGTE